MKPGRNIVAIGRSIARGSLALVGMVACAAGSGAPPAVVPIKLESVGVVADFHLNVREHLIYIYELRFEFPEGDQTERARIRKIIGGQRVDKSGTPVEPGAPALVRLTITRVDTVPPLVVYTKLANPLLTSWGADSFGKIIGHCDLPPGRYRFQLESLSATSEYGSIPTKFTVGMDKFKTSFDPKTADRSKSCQQ